MPCQALVKMLAKKPGWKETNFQVNCDSVDCKSPACVQEVEDEILREVSDLDKPVLMASLQSFGTVLPIFLDF